MNGSARSQYLQQEWVVDFFLLLNSYRANEIPNKDHKLESLHDNGILHTVCDLKCSP